MLKKLKKRIEVLEDKKREIMADVKNGKIISYDGVIEAGKKLELLRVEIWAIESAIQS